MERKTISSHIVNFIKELRRASSESLCQAHMSEEGWEQKYVKEAFDTNWATAE